MTELSSRKITILTPVFNEENGLSSYVETVKRVLIASDDYEFHVVFIDDGSSDNSWNIISEICEAEPRFTGIRLSRNFGSHAAITAGFQHADGDAVATLAADLQDPAETVLEFAKTWWPPDADRRGPHIVWGKRRSREDDAWRAITSNLFMTLLRKFAMPKGSKFATGSFFLADRRVVECYREFKETNRITFALVAWTGFDQEVVEYDRARRQTGQSGWNFRKMIHAMYDAFIGFSTLPIRVITVVGLTTFLVAMSLAAYVVISWISGAPVPGWASIVLSVSIFSGIQFFILGMVGEYLYRIYAEVVQRPLFFISDETHPAPDPRK